jgi:hypothetical protein
VTTILRWSKAAAFAALALLPPPLAAQQHYAAATAVAPVIAELEAMRPMEDSSFQIHSFFLARDAATISLGNGRIWPLTRVNGRVIGAIYQGTGRLTFKAPNPVERERLHHYLGADSLDDAITSVTFLFTDGTLDEIYRLGITAEHAEASGPLRNNLSRARDYLKVYQDKTWNADFLEPVLNGRENGMFFALIQREHGEELILQIDPDDPEPVSLSLHSQWPGGDVDPEVITQFAWSDRPAPPPDTRRREVGVEKYVLDINMPQQLDGGVAFITSAQMHLRIPAGGYGPWIPFDMYRELEIDSAKWDGVATPVTKDHDSWNVWVRAPARLDPGATPVLTLNYHGDMLARYDDWFVLKSSIEWYPQPLDGLSKASFDITYHTPLGHPIGSIGVRTDSSVTGRLVNSHWVHEEPMRNAGSNIGRFKAYDLTAPGVPPVTLLWSEAGHRAISRNFNVAPIAHVREVITDEVASSVRFFTNVYGPPTEPKLWATEIPDPHGEAFPGLIHYYFGTFLPDQTHDGWNQLFRAHEVAHQWWGIGVDFASYHDQWLSEGLANFSGLWYMQTRLGSLDKYLGMLREWRGDLLAARGHMGAVALGHRAGDGRQPQYGTYALYEKGAWTAHMLRILMLQMSDMNEDRFKNAMREFYTTYRGHSATTEDLRHVMEKNAGADLGWFFDEWIDGTSIPTYTWAWHAEDAGSGQTRVKLRVKQTDAPISFQMYVPVTVELQDGRMLRTRVHVTGPETDVDLPLLPGAVKSVKFNDFEGALAEVKTESW